MPTLALSNTVAFSILKRNGYDTIKDFPPIRVLGTIGFIAAMWFVNCAAYTSDEGFFFSVTSENRFQYTFMQFFVSGVLGLILAFYSITLPTCSIAKRLRANLFLRLLDLMRLNFLDKNAWLCSSFFNVTWNVITGNKWVCNTFYNKF